VKPPPVVAGRYNHACQVGSQFTGKIMSQKDDSTIVIEQAIMQLRGQKVLLDADLARLCNHESA
jgi:hypothetical protein